MKQEKRGKKNTLPISKENRTDPKTNAQRPIADPLELRMKREGHDM